MYKALASLKKFLHIQDAQKRWVSLAVLSLAISGLYSIILVLMRTPVVTSIIGYDSEFKQQLFRTALIVHVDLSVLVWMLSIACCRWQSALPRKETLASSAYYLFLIGVVTISLSPLFGGTPSLNNYVPILDNLPFIIGIAFLLCATLMMVSSVMLFAKHYNIEVISSAAIFIACVFSFILSTTEAEVMLHGSVLDRGDYYELLFWGPGHILQFLYVHLAMVAWRVLSISKQYENVYDFIIMLNSLFAISGLACHFLAPTDESFILITGFFTDHMRYFGGIAPTLAAIVILIKFYEGGFRFMHFSCAAILSSFILFFSGGLIALMISGYNVTIPAHYHGSVVGVSVALMGLIYKMLDIQKVRGAAYQLYLYMIGQMMHITGLAISGGYGALRKTPGDEFPIHIKASMGLMGLGGLVAIIGGLMFVVICWKALSSRDSVHIGDAQ